MKIKKSDMMRLWDISLTIRSKLEASAQNPCEESDAISQYRETSEIESGYPAAFIIRVSDILRDLAWLQPDYGFGELCGVMRAIGVEVEE